MDKVYQAETVDAAIKKGLDELKVSESDIRIDVEERGSKGFLGIGKKDAVVKLSIINPELKAFDTIEALISRDEHMESEQREEAPTIAPSESQKLQEQEETEAGTEEAPLLKADMSIEEAAESTADYIHRVVSAMDIDHTVSFSIDHHQIWIVLESSLAAKLIGKRGQTLNALEEMAQNYFNGRFKSHGSIILDIENYRMKRKETLENLAVNMSKKALRNNESIKLEPMPSFERKIMHHVLSNLENVKTYSEGKEPNRYIVIEKK